MKKTIKSVVIWGLIVAAYLHFANFQCNSQNHNNNSVEIIKHYSVSASDSTLLSYVNSNYPVSHVCDFYTSYNSVSFKGTIGEYIILADVLGLIIYKTSTNSARRIEGVYFLEIFGDYIYGLNSNLQLLKIDPIRIEIEVVVNEKVYSYVITPDGISYQTANEETEEVFLVACNRRINIPHIGLYDEFDDEPIFYPSPVIWSPNGRYALYYRDLLDEFDKEYHTLYIVDMTNGSIQKMSVKWGDLQWFSDNIKFAINSSDDLIHIFSRESLAQIGGVAGKFHYYVVADNHIYAMQYHFDAINQRPRESIVKFNISNDSLVEIFHQHHISTWKYLPSRDFLIVSDLDSLRIVDTNGQIQGQFTGITEFFEWQVDRHGFLGMVFNVNGRYLVRVYKIQW